MGRMDRFMTCREMSSQKNFAEKTSASEFDWNKCIARRKERLARLLELNAPTIIIDRECLLLRKAIHKTHYLSPMMWDDIVYEFWDLLGTLRLVAHMWYLKKRGMTEEEAWDHIFGKDPE